MDSSGLTDQDMYLHTDELQRDVVTGWIQQYLFLLLCFNCKDTQDNHQLRRLSIYFTIKDGNFKKKKSVVSL